MARFGPRQLGMMKIVRRARRDLFDVLRRRRRQARVPRVELGPRPPMTRRLLHRVRDAAPVDVDLADRVVAERSGRRELLRGDGVRQGLVILRRPGPSGLDVASVCRFERARPLVPRQSPPLHFSSSASCPVVVRRPVRRSSCSYDGADHRCSSVSRGPLLSCVGLTFVLGAGASCEWWACVGLEAARGAGAASFRAGRLGGVRGTPHAGAARRVSPLLPCTPVVWPRKLALIQSTHER